MIAYDICLSWLFLLLWYFGPMFKANSFDNISDETLEKQTIKPGSFLDKLYIFRNTTPKLKLVAIMFVVFFLLTLICTVVALILYFLFNITNSSMTYNLIFGCNLGIEMFLGSGTIIYLNCKGNYVIKRFFSKNIYKKIRTDFSFVKEFGYMHDLVYESHVVPSILFCSANRKIQIGVNFENDKIFILYYERFDALDAIDVLGGCEFESRRYKKQVEAAKSVLKSFLEKNSKQ